MAQARARTKPAPKKPAGRKVIETHEPAPEERTFHDIHIGPGVPLAVRTDESFNTVIRVFDVDVLRGLHSTLSNMLAELDAE